MGIRSYIRDRKQVKASRATESGRPPASFESSLDNWGTPDPEHVKKMDALYEQHMHASREKRKAKEAEAEERNKPTPKAKVIPTPSDDSRMRYLGDD
jgi:hypothetical protein